MILERTRRRWRKRTKRAVFALLKRAPSMRHRLRTALYKRRGRRYERMCARTTVDPRIVVFECYAGRAYACSPRALYQEMLADERFADHTFVWVLRPKVVRALAAVGGYDVRTSAEIGDGGSMVDKLDRLFGAEALEELRNAVIVSYASVPYYEFHARAGHWISNYIVPTHMRPREGQTYVQTWHGTPLKRLGCDIARDKTNAMYSSDDIYERYRREGERFTYLLSPSAFTSERLGSAFDLTDDVRMAKVIEEGYPRNDFLHTFTTEQAEAIRRRLGIPDDRRVVLYAPTFRDDQHDAGTGYTLKATLDFDVLRERLGDDHVILFRPHYLIANRFDFSRYEGFVFDVSAVKDVNDLYVVSDVLVTDYSSVFFDYANLRRPIVFYMYDQEQYAEQLRGFYLDLEELPGPIVRTAGDLADAVAAASPADASDPRYWRFNRGFTYHDDGNAARRVLERLFGSAQARRSAGGGSD